MFTTKNKFAIFLIPLFSLLAVALSQTARAQTPASDTPAPEISKIGLLLPGEAGGIGERIEWVITITNNSALASTNLTIIDQIPAVLRIDSAKIDQGTLDISGRRVVAQIPTVAPGESVSFNIVTTVLENNVVVDNTATLQADNLDDPISATSAPITAGPVRELPRTGESPWWRAPLIIIGFALLVLFFAIIALITIRRKASSHRE